MQRAQKNPIFTGVMILIVSGFMISCTKEVPYKKEYKEQVHAKSEIDEKAEYLYVPSSGLTNHDDLGASGAMAYSPSEAQIVKFRFTEKSLQVYKNEEEARLKGNQTNDRVILEIPVDHIEFRCAKDRYGKCTNAEEQNNETSWNKKTNFKPNMDGLKSLGASLLPIEVEQLFGSACFSESSSRILDYTITSDALNIRVEKVFKGNAACVEQQGNELRNLDDLQSQIIFQYSFTKLNKIASSNYEPVMYPRLDERTFGFFETSTSKLDTGYVKLEKNETKLMNRWNPKRKEVNYYMSDSYAKPEYAVAKKATLLAFEKVNQGLREAGVNIHLKLNEPANKDAGDARNSMIILVEDPDSSGVMGYGPTIKNPRTGEILSARVSMYYGNMVASVRTSYDEVVRNLRVEKEISKALTGTPARLGSDPAFPSVSPVLAAHTAAATSNSTNSMKTLWQKAGLVARQKQARKSQNPPKSKLTASRNERSASDLAKMTARQFEKTLMHQTAQASLKETVAAQIDGCYYPADSYSISEAIKTGLRQQFDQELKLWAELSEEEKSKVIDLILPHTWVPTLVHELGHNLGLRHNFSGSEDEANFYTKEELAKFGIKNKAPFASIMDYGYSMLTELPTLGKYDIAALRFGYKREVEDARGVMLKLEPGQTLKDLNSHVLRDFKYCTDEFTSTNPNCKRFDEGTSLDGIAKFLIKAYEEGYESSNYRNGRKTFSITGDKAYASRVIGQFRNLRNFMEAYQSLKDTYKVSDDAAEWQQIPFLKDLQDAAIRSGRFFLSVLEMPDTQCLIAKKENPETIEEIVELNAVNPTGISCFKDLPLPAGYIVVGQGGKAFNNKRHEDSQSEVGEIDVRGIALDKIIAARLFFDRTGLVNTSESNYLDMSMLFPEIMATMKDILLNESTPTVDFKNENGYSVGTFQVVSRIFSAPQDGQAVPLAHWIERPMDSSLAKVLDLPMRTISFQEVLLQSLMTKLNKSPAHAAADRDFTDMFTIIKTNKSYQLASNLKAVTRDLGVTRLVALNDNAFGEMSIKNAQNYDKLKGMTEDTLGRLHSRLLAKREAQKNGTLAPSAASFTFASEYRDIRSHDVRLFSKGRLNASTKAYTLLKNLNSDEIAKIYWQLKSAEDVVLAEQALKEQKILADRSSKTSAAQSETQAEAMAENSAPAEKDEFTAEQLALEPETVAAYASALLNGPLFDYLATILPASNAQQ